MLPLPLTSHFGNVSGDGLRRKECFPDRTIEVEGCSVPSGVSDQPFSDSETKLGAMNRARGAKLQGGAFDFFAGGRLRLPCHVWQSTCCHRGIAANQDRFHGVTQAVHARRCGDRA